MPYNKKFADTLYNADWLRREYVEKGRNAAQMAAEIGATNSAVLDRLRRAGIEVRSVAETQRMRTDKSRGSHAPRPRAKFMATLSNPDWLQEQYVQLRRSTTDIANEIGASHPAVIAALRRAGITTRTISEARTGIATYRLADDKICDSAGRARARKMVPVGPCALCGGEGLQINHQDRNPRNNGEDNLERLCARCHTQQHHMEEQVMIEWLADRGVAYRAVHDEARMRIMADREISPVSPTVPSGRVRKTPNRRQFLATLHNRAWMEERWVVRKETAVAIAKEAGSSGPAVLMALRKHFGVSDRRKYNLAVETNVPIVDVPAPSR